MPLPRPLSPDPVVSLNHTRRFHTDPSGTFMRYEAKAIGSGSEAAQSELQDKWHSVTDDPIDTHGLGLTFCHSNLLSRTLNYWLCEYSSRSWRKNWTITTFRSHRYVIISFCFVPVGLKAVSPGHPSEWIRNSGSGTTERGHRSNVMYHQPGRFAIPLATVPRVKALEIS